MHEMLEGIRASDNARPSPQPPVPALRWLVDHIDERLQPERPEGPEAPLPASTIPLIRATGSIGTVNDMTNGNHAIGNGNRTPRHTPYVLLAIKNGKTFNELIAETKIPPSTLSRSRKLLLKADMIRTRPLAADEYCRGMWKYIVTDKGKDLCKNALRLVEANDAFWSKLRESRRDDL